MFIYQTYMHLSIVAVAVVVVVVVGRTTTCIRHVLRD